MPRRGKYPAGGRMSRDTCARCPETSQSGPKGIRTPDLLAASHPGPDGVLTSANAHRRIPKRALLFAVSGSGLEPPSVEGLVGDPDALAGRRDRQSLALKAFHLPQLRDDLLDAVLPRWHGSPPFRALTWAANHTDSGPNEGGPDTRLGSSRLGSPDPATGRYLAARDTRHRSRSTPPD